MNQQNSVSVRFSDDKMRAFLYLSSGGQVNAGAVLAELLRCGVVHGLNTALIHRMVDESVFDRFVEVARGTPVKPPVDAKIEILVDMSKIGRFSDFMIVTEGVPLARRIPFVLGADGMDVLGNVIKAAAAKDAPLLGGQGTVVDGADPNLLLSSMGGSFTQLYNGLIEVRQCRKIEGDVNSAGGNISFPGDLIITGSVHSDCAVEAAGSLKILGDVHDAVVRCRGDMVLRGGILGGSKAAVSAGRCVKAKFIHNVKLTAAEDVLVSEDIINAKINTNGVLRARVIVGGNVAAAGGISVSKAGSERGEGTILDIGAMCNYEKEIENLTECITAQNIMNDGCVSELFCYVRDNMDENGVISDDNHTGFQELKGNLAESINMRLEFEKSLAEIERLLKSVSDSMIAADEIYPNVLMRFGYSEYLVKETLQKVSVRPGEPIFK